MPEPTAPNAEAVSRVAEKLVVLERKSQLALNVAAGEIVVAEFFSGDLAAWNARNTGEDAIPALAAELARRDSAWTASRLYRAVRFFEQSKVFGGFDRWPNLTATHFLKVQGLPWDNQKVLLDEAEAKHATVKDLEAAIGDARRRPAGVEAPAKDAERALKSIERALSIRDHLFADLADAGLPVQSGERLLRAFDTLRIEIERVRVELAPKPAAPEPPKARL